MDCMEYMKTCKDNQFDLAIVDPPYGINAPSLDMGSKPGYKSTAAKLRKVRLNSGGGKLSDRSLNTMNCDWDKEVPSPEYFHELFRVSKNQIVWGGNYFDLPPTRGVICWDKLQPWENFSQWEMAWTSFDCTAPIVRISNTGGNNKDKKIHPTQKPVKLYEWLLEKFAVEGDSVLDTHCGSASSAIAAARFGFEFVGCEIDPFFHEASLKRFDEMTVQNDLFYNKQ